MVSRNSTNVLEFDTQNFGAPVSYYTVTCPSSLTTECNPEEAVEAIVELIGKEGTLLAVGAESNGEFRIAVENSTWTASTLETALQGLGSTVGSNNYDCSTTTVADFTF
tara:strand:- start:55 stop:381 length:327 start_codon:yes stop_codon:yes gene_type:complete